jgi:hypothetical protein
MSIKSIKYSSLENSIADSQVKKIPVKYLIIAGGGSGNRGGNDFGGPQGTGGGGSGGYLSSMPGELSGTSTPAGDPHEITLGKDYKVEVGAGATNTYGNFSSQGTSTFDAIVAVPGGGGGSIGYTHSFFAGGSGGSAGGGGNSYTNVRHYPGQGGRPGNVNAGSGGGGASDAYTATRNGLDGLSSSITGSAVVRAGGGAGSRQNTNTGNSGGAGGGGGNGASTSASGIAGAVNTGSGGGAGGNGNSNNNRGAGGLGGSGVVILRYPAKYTISIGVGLTAGTETTDGDEKYIEITAGSDNVSWS